MAAGSTQRPPPATSNPRPGSQAPAGKSRDPRPLAQHGGEIRQLSAVRERPLMTGPGSVGCHTSGGSASPRWSTLEGRQGGRDATHDDQRRVTVRRSRAHSVPSKTEHLGCIWVASKGCRTGSERGVWREQSLEMGGGAYGIRTHVTAVRAPSGVPFRVSEAAV
jgi:hypothetical protein